MTFRVTNSRSIARVWFLWERWFNNSISGRYVHHDYPISHRKHACLKFPRVDTTDQMELEGCMR